MFHEVMTAAVDKTFYDVTDVGTTCSLMLSFATAARLERSLLFSTCCFISSVERNSMSIVRQQELSHARTSKARARHGGSLTKH